MLNTSFSATVVTLPSAGVAIPSRLTLAVPSNAQWKGSEKSRTQTRPRNATRYVTWYLFLVMKVTRIEMSQINTKHHKRTHTSLTFRLLYLGRFITWKPTHKGSICIKNLNTVSRYFPLALLTFRPIKTQNTAPARNWNPRFPLLNISTKISQIPHPAKPIVDPRQLPSM